VVVGAVASGAGVEPASVRDAARAADHGERGGAGGNGADGVERLLSQEGS
jgi:hypothetical protein